MNEPRLRRPVSLVLVQVVIVLGLVAGWLTILGTLSKTLFDGNYTLEVQLADDIPESLARGQHSLGGTEAEPASAELFRSGGLLRLFDVAPLPFFGVRFLGILTWFAAVMALHLVDRIVRATTAAQPFALVNSKRCQWIGWWMTISWLFSLAQVQAIGPIVRSADVEGLQRMAMWGLPDIDYTGLVLAFCGFCAAAVLRYGADLEHERSLTV